MTKVHITSIATILAAVDGAVSKVPTVDRMPIKIAKLIMQIIRVKRIFIRFHKL